MRALVALALAAGCRTGPLTTALDDGGAPTADLRGPVAIDMAVLPGFGAPCQTTSECPRVGQYQGVCLVDLPGGDCVLPCAHGYSCPLPDSQLCDQLPTHQAQCFPTCTSDSDCRIAEGYRCCATTLTFNPPGTVCIPGPCAP